MFTSEIGATFECQVDSEPIEECEAPYEVEIETEPINGPHTFRVRATDLGLNVGEWATYNWTIVGPPETLLGDTPPATGAPANATFTFSSDQTNSVFFCALDGAELTLCHSPKSYANLIDGEHTFEVAARNPLGDSDETPAEYLWEVAVPPETFINAKPDAVTTSTIANFTFTANELDATFECSLDNSAYTECEVPIDPPYSGLGEGMHNFKVRAIDQMGNIDASPAEYDVARQLRPEHDDHAEAERRRRPTRARTSSSPRPTPTRTFECRLDNGAWTRMRLRPVTYTNLAIGGHNIAVRATDQYGVVDDTPAAYAWTITDATAPETEIVDVQAGSVIIYFTGSDNFSADAALTFECRLDNSAWSTCTSPKTYTDAELAAGPHTFDVRAVDEAGNRDQSPDSHTWNTPDTIAPNTTITDKPDEPDR